MVLFIGSILSYALGMVGIHGTYVMLAAIAISYGIGYFLRSKNIMGSRGRRQD